MVRPFYRCRSRADDVAFTLIEIVVVLTLVTLLVSIALPAVHGARERSLVGRGRVELFLIASALEDFRRLYGDYPQTGDSPHALVDTSVTLAAAQAETQLFNALTGVFRSTAFGSSDCINGPSFLETGKFTLENPTSSNFQKATGSPSRKSEELTCFVDPWGRRYLYYYKSATHPEAWRPTSYLLFSAGPDGKLIAPDSQTGLFPSNREGAGDNADNIVAWDNH